MHIGLTRLLEDGTTTADYDLKRGLYGGPQSLGWGNNKKIEEAKANVEDNKDEIENP